MWMLPFAYGGPSCSINLGLSLIGFKNLEISSFALPFFDLLWFILRQVGPHRKVRLR